MAADLPPLASGTVLRLAPDDWRHHGAQDGHLLLRFGRYRRDISRFYDAEVWVEGTRLDGNGQEVGPFQALVRIDSLDAAAVPAGRHSASFDPPQRSVSGNAGSVDRP